MIRCYESTVFLIYLCRSLLVFLCFLFFFSKQKTAYEMRISDWSSDVCSSDLAGGPITEASMAAAARVAGLDPAAIAKAAQAPGIDDEIRTNLAMAGQLGVNGTPAWVIGDRVLSGAMTLDQMKDAVADARKQS